MFIYKQPRIGCEVSCHQDSTLLHTETLSVKGFWFALEDSTQENGCLWAIHGAHKNGLKSQFYRRENGAGTEMEVLDDSARETSKLVPLEAKTGTMVLLHRLLPHISYANRSSRTRHAYTLHYL